LGSYGGKDVADTTRRVLRTMLHNCVAVSMNFAGRGGKYGVENMKLLRLVVGKNCCLTGPEFVTFVSTFECNELRYIIPLHFNSSTFYL